MIVTTNISMLRSSVINRTRPNWSLLLFRQHDDILRTVEVLDLGIHLRYWPAGSPGQQCRTGV